MADLKKTCIEGFCSDVPEYRAGEHITITGDEIRIIAADLTNYYNKSEVDALINAIETGEFVIVQSLPATGNPKNIYLVPKTGGGYTEHVYIEGEGWEEIGDTDIDLSNYYNKTQTDALLANKQDALTAGDGIEINGNVISATGGSYEFPVVHITSLAQLNAIDYPCMIYGGIEIPDTGFSGYDWNGVVIPTSGQITQIIDFGNVVFDRVQDSPPSGAWTVKRLDSAFTLTKSTGSYNLTLNKDGTAQNTVAVDAVKDIGNSNTVTFAYSKEGLGTGATWAAAWNGYELRAITPKNLRVAGGLPNAIVSGSSVSKSVPSGTITFSDASYTFPSAGTFIGWVQCRFPTNATGIRVLDGAVNSSYQGASIRMPASTNGETILAVPVVYYGAAGSKIGARLYQTSGSALTVTNIEARGYFISA